MNSWVSCCACPTNCGAKASRHFLNSYIRDTERLLQQSKRRAGAAFGSTNERLQASPLCWMGLLISTKSLAKARIKFALPQREPKGN